MAVSQFRGVGALIIGIVAIAALLVAAAYTAHTLVLVIVAAAVAAVVILHFRNKRPVKTPEDDQIRLNLDK
jgi:apolipoprotein N-acyltransferase